MNTIRQTLFSDPAVIELLAQLKQLPDTIRSDRDALSDRESEVTELSQSLQDLKDKIKEKESEAFFIAQNETEEVPGKKEGETVVKAKWSNDTQRQARANQICREDPEWINLANQLPKLRAQKIDAENHLAKTRNLMMWSIDKMKTAMASAALITGLSHETINTEIAKELAEKEAKVYEGHNILSEAISKFQSVNGGN